MAQSNLNYPFYHTGARRIWPTFCIFKYIFLKENFTEALADDKVFQNTYLNSQHNMKESKILKQDCGNPLLTIFH